MDVNVIELSSNMGSAMIALKRRAETIIYSDPEQYKMITTATQAAEKPLMRARSAIQYKMYDEAQTLLNQVRDILYPVAVAVDEAKPPVPAEVTEARAEIDAAYTATLDRYKHVQKSTDIATIGEIQMDVERLRKQLAQANTCIEWSKYDYALEHLSNAKQLIKGINDKIAHLEAEAC